MDTPLVKRAYNLGLKAVPNFTCLSEEQIAYYEKNLNKLQEAIQRGFIIPEKQVIKKPRLDFTIQVDRSIKPVYPDWVSKKMHPELELTGPTKYNLKTKVESWLHEKQKTGVVSGNEIYTIVKDEDFLNDCLGLSDLLAIQEKGAGVFRAVFGNQAVFAWKSVVAGQGGYLRVPYLVASGGRVVLNWDWLDDSWRSSNPGLRFRK